MRCFCRGGPTCCMRQSLYEPMSSAPTGPFKCPDCDTWWTGEHRCPPSLYRESVCTCQQSPNGLIPTTVNCPVHGSWTYTTSQTDA